MTDWPLIFISAAILAVAIPVVMLFFAKGRMWLTELRSEGGRPILIAQGLLAYLFLCCMAVLVVYSVFGVLGPIAFMDTIYRR